MLMSLTKNIKTLSILSGITVIIICFANAKSFAQENKREEPNTLFGDNRVTGYGALEFKYSQIMDQDAIILGGQGGVLLNQHVSLGLGGYTSVTSIPFEGTNPTGTLRTEFGYTGISLGYNIAPKKLIHLHIPVLFAVGYVEVVQNSTDYPGVSPSVPNEIFVENTTVFVIEPAANFEINIAKFMRFSAGISYRLVHNINLENPISNDDFTALSINTSLIFGNFE